MSVLGSAVPLRSGFAALGLLLAAGCGGRGAVSEHAPCGRAETFDAAAAMREVRDFVALGPRDSTTPGAERAANHLAERLRAFGLTPEIDAFKDETPIGVATFRNVTVRLRGRTPRTLVLVSHYDTKSGLGPDFVGANDSGSSTGLLLALAEHLSRCETLPLDVLLAFVDGEEAMDSYGPDDGLHGSRHLAQTLAPERERVHGVVVVDMIGDRNLDVMLPANGSRELKHAVLQAAERQGVRSLFRLESLGVIDDHVPFLEQRMPAVNLIDFTFGPPGGGNDYWHTTEDTLDKLAVESLDAVGRVVLDLLWAIPASASQD